MPSPRKPAKKPPGKASTRPPTRKDLPIFPPAWVWLFDEAIPAFAKNKYSPQESWKGKPFGKEDAKFFFRGIEELSELFTEERPHDLPNYFTHPKYRSSYLLYFVALQAAKFVTLFERHPLAMEAVWQHGKKHGVIRVADLGVGPGTASLSLLLALLGRAVRTGEEIPPVELHWVDLNRAAMNDGVELVELLANHFTRLRGKVKVELYPGTWTQEVRRLPKQLSLVLMGNLLNEGAHEPLWNPGLWENLLARCEGGGLLSVEPASRGPSQTLSRLRDWLFEQEQIEATPASLWGPCLHAGKCPMAEGRDWCHFSVPVEIPGKWFREFSKALSSERTWAKFSYLWIASREARAPITPDNFRRAISDPIRPPESRGMADLSKSPATLLLCEPEEPRRVTVPASFNVHRGDLVDLPKIPAIVRIRP